MAKQGIDEQLCLDYFTAFASSRTHGTTAVFTWLASGGCFSREIGESEGGPSTEDLLDARQFLVGLAALDFDAVEDKDTVATMPEQARPLLPPSLPNPLCLLDSMNSGVAALQAL